MGQPPPSPQARYVSRNGLTIGGLISASEWNQVIPDFIHGIIEPCFCKSEENLKQLLGKGDDVHFSWNSWWSET